MVRPTIRQGSTGADVSECQRLLCTHGYKCAIDGDFGPGTRKQVIAFQTKFFGSDEADGVVGPKTWDRLDDVNPKPDPDAKYSGVVRLKKGENIQLSKDFHLSEYECKCSRCTETVVDFNHIAKLQALRTNLGRGISINSAYRCPAHNAEVGGVPNSEHVQGCATDIVVDGMSPSAVQRACEGFDGLGHYADFTHVDSRGYYARW